MLKVHEELTKKVILVIIGARGYSKNVDSLAYVGLLFVNNHEQRKFIKCGTLNNLFWLETFPIDSLKESLLA